MTLGSRDSSAEQFTRGYIQAFDEETAKAANSKELFAAMKKRYPRVGLDISLDFSSKVAKRELAWE